MTGSNISLGCKWSPVTKTIATTVQNLLRQQKVFHRNINSDECCYTGGFLAKCQSALCYSAGYHSINCYSANCYSGKELF
jgi:hypothetical protein